MRISAQEEVARVEGLNQLYVCKHYLFSSTTLCASNILSSSLFRISDAVHLYDYLQSLHGAIRLFRLPRYA